MNPKQLGLMIHEATGRIVIVLKKPKTTQVLKDVTTDFALMHAAEILKHDAEGTSNVYEATDRYGNVLEIEITAKLISQRKTLDPSG
jgi:hypothetical protein